MSTFPSYRAEYTQYITTLDCHGPGSSPSVTLLDRLSFKMPSEAIKVLLPENRAFEKRY
jgi:hypothetical protein